MVIKNNFFFFLLLCSALIAQDQAEKCATFRQVQLLTQAKKFNTKLPARERPILQTSILTHNKKIRIHYDTLGNYAPAMVDIDGNRIPNSYQNFIDTLRIILDSVWDIEINSFGFVEPPNDNKRGGGDEYDFYVFPFLPDFGETVIEYDLPVGITKFNQQYASFIWIHNDFGIGFRTKGVPAILATTAHEFHHAIQIGGSGVWESEHFYFYELCAEAMENTVFKEAKDYIFDVKRYFANISSVQLLQPWSFEYRGYERAILGMFLMKKYGTVIMKEIWNEMKINRPIPALKNTMALHLSTIGKEFSDFSLWNFYTNYRSDSTKYFTDAKLFPSVSYSEQISLSNNEIVLQKTSRSFVANYIRVDHELDTAFFIIANTNLDDAETNAGQIFAFELQTSPFAYGSLTKINNSIYAKFSVNDFQNWSYILSTDTAGIKKPSNFDNITIFPNPFKPKFNNLLFLSLKEISDDNNNITLSIFSSAADLVFSAIPQFTNIYGKRFAVWNGRDNNGNIVPSGVYFYLLSKDSQIFKGKFAVIK